MQAEEEAAPSARDGAAHPGDSSQPQEAERRDWGQSGDSHGGFQEGVHELTGRDGAGRAEHQGVKCRGNHCTALSQLQASLISPMYQAGCQEHGPWLHGDSPPEREAAMSGAPPQHPSPPGPSWG